MSLPENSKLMSIRTFLKRKADFKPGHKLVFTNGCFDILHPGHVDLLTRARALGDSLILGLNSDESVRMLGKGDDRPLNPQEDRAFVLAALACVDYIVIFHESTPLELIKACRPQILVKGGDWPVDQIVGGDVVEKAGGKVHSLKLLEGYSTTSFLEKVRG
ncbi:MULTISPECIES: D-glycero-beta-D-manno-heptose 1-phosphate adenylyltransferase [unclassified Pseudodesulfovibrio]|uniref:D-glycero-beta-D-manno-heptose 1-phosphate adenylyltransferase n=1 Tax=unclassified Pseudodesulfovibrio TaxID=2661612 RepID=UPI000FEC16BE|nr:MULTISPECIES: D-glycero-beta-D-manno-heptose 1-phosphate adenylyltransferase [unclassified Pseudodesulfovibrio]MCJ2166188.1 D-glycero-beta-D-manno-heptose 1-phosphate adenylyltransferase [Pseudodesulfovibrio sp. S3-i]RWU02325.1 D-glycero-beta-D-manno-heptose 1-phosphate adenylyltransferase [Pseudodesulfovibrio sp. S3]